MADPLAERIAEHHLVATFEEGQVYWDVRCPYDLAESSRPCWPHQENGEPEPVERSNFCNYREWVENSECIEIHGELVLRINHVVWDGGSPMFHAYILNEQKEPRLLPEPPYEETVGDYI